MTVYVRTTRQIPVRHWAKADGTCTEMQLPAGTLALCVGEAGPPGGYELVVVEGEFADDECWHVPEDAFQILDDPEGGAA